MSLILPYKPLLKRLRGTPEYDQLRRLLRELQRSRHLEEMLQAQNQRLYQAARERDLLLWKNNHDHRRHCSQVSVAVSERRSSQAR